MKSLADVFDVRFPIVQSGMGRIAGAELAAAVSNAGGLGVLAALNVPPDDLRAQIRRLRGLTDRPFGVNLWLHPDLMPPIDPASLPAETIAGVTDALNAARRAIGLPEARVPPDRVPDSVGTAIDIIIEEKVPVWSTALGLPKPEIVARCRTQGVKLMMMVTNVDDARAAVAAGADAIVAQGLEAGGHRSSWRADAPAGAGTFALVPEIVDAVDVPVLAAGGIADGRGLVAARALGAAGVLMGTRFVATRESQAPPFWKQAILSSTTDKTIVTRAFTGLPARLLRSTFAADYDARSGPVLPGLLQARMQQDIWAKAAADGNAEYFPMYAGQSAGLIHDVPGAGEVVAAIVAEANAVIERLRDRT